MKSSFKYIAAAAGLGVGSLFISVALSQAQEGGRPEIILHKPNPHQGFAPTAGSTSTQSPPIINHGGLVLGSPTVYLIWYGDWNQSNNTDTPGGQNIVRTFLGGLGGSSYYQINKSYVIPSGTFGVGPETADGYSQGKNLSDAGVQAVVKSALSSGKLPVDPNGVYFVLTSSDVAESSGFCSNYCGWHTYGSISSANIKYAFVGNASRCLNACAAQTVGPNGNAGVDGMISVIAHELEEANTDPNLNAWFDRRGSENADKCAWTFGQNLIKAPNGAYYNLALAGGNFLVQRNLNAKDSRCYVSADGLQ